MPHLDNPVALTSFILNVYTWVAICILLLFLFFIAQFYEKKSGQRSFYPAFLISIACFALAAFLYLPLLPAITGNVLGDILRFVGGLTLVIFGLMLFSFMMGGRA